MPEVSSSSSRSGSISQASAATSETKASGPTQEAQVAEGQLQVRAEIVSDNIPPPEQAVPPTSSQAASQAATSGETKVRGGLATLALPNQASPREKGSINDLRRTQSAFDIEGFRARSPSSRSRMPNHPSMGSPRTEGFPNSNSAGEMPFDEWDTVETKQPPSRKSTASTASTSAASPSGSPLSRSSSSRGIHSDGSGQSSPSMSPVGSDKLPPHGTRVLPRSASAMQMPNRTMTSFEKVEVILQNPVMRAEAESLLDGLFATEVMPFMKNYDAFVNAKTDVERGAAYAEIYELHLREGSNHCINVYGGVVKELKELGQWGGPMPANSPLVGKLQAVLVEVKKLMYGALNVQVAADPHYRRAHDLLHLAAQPPAPTKAVRTSLSGKVKGFLTRYIPSPKQDSPPSSSGSSSSSSSSSTPISSSSSSQANHAHRASAVRSSGSSGPRSIASAEAHDYINMDAVLASPGATRDLRAYLRRGFENMPGVGTENLDFLESYVDFAAETDPAEIKRLLTAMIDKFVQQGSPSEINLMGAGLRTRLVETSRAWIAQGGAAMPQALVDDLAKARRQIETLLQDKGNALDLLRKELFPNPAPKSAT